MDGKKHPAELLADDNPARGNYDWYEWVGKAEDMLRRIPALEAERDALRAELSRSNYLAALLQEQVQNLKVLAAAPAAPQAAQPVAWRYRSKGDPWTYVDGPTQPTWPWKTPECQPLHAAPQAAQPLTAAQRFDAYARAEKVMAVNESKSWRDAIADEIERAHDIGIGKEPKP